MSRNPGLTINVHVRDETEFSTTQIPSSDKDFVSVKIGWDVAIMLFTPEQAKALYVAAVDAYSLLKKIETEAETAAMNNIWEENTLDDWNGVEF